VRGVGSYGNPDVNVLARAGSEPPHVTIGRYCSFGPGVKMVVNGDHRSDWVTTWPARILLGLEGAERDGHPQASGPIVIGNDVWIGTEALILGGVTIGDGAVVATRAVVTHDVRPYAIVAGMPAVERRRRFDDDVVERLLALRWWDLEPDQVAEAVDVLCHAPELDRLEQRVAELRAG
jgi:acetyltransferase-like isoleucine patch superfamily enzyme